jgi:hypothetical protein
MTANDLRETVRTAQLPRPRTAGDDTGTPEAVVEATVEVPTQTSARSQDAHYPWPEPWHFSRAARPRTEFWDVATASWRSRGPVSVPPKAD